MAAVNRRQKLAAIIMVLVLLRRKKKGKRQHRFWVRDIFRKREELGVFHTLAQEMEANDREYFFRYVHLCIFMYILHCP